MESSLKSFTLDRICIQFSLIDSIRCIHREKEKEKAEKKSFRRRLLPENIKLAATSAAAASGLCVYTAHMITSHWSERDAIHEKKRRRRGVPLFNTRRLFLTQGKYRKRTCGKRRVLISPLAVRDFRGGRRRAGVGNHSRTRFIQTRKGSVSSKDVYDAIPGPEIERERGPTFTLSFLCLPRVYITMYSRKERQPQHTSDIGGRSAFFFFYSLMAYDIRHTQQK